jgi:hypothetical protein
VLGKDDAVLAGIAQLLAPGGIASALVSVVPRDGVPAVPAPDELAAAYARHGLSLDEARPATPAEVTASRSSWAKRLRAGSARPVTLLRASDGLGDRLARGRAAERDRYEPGDDERDAGELEQRGVLAEEHDAEQHRADRLDRERDRRQRGRQPR